MSRKVRYVPLQAKPADITSMIRWIGSELERISGAFRTLGGSITPQIVGSSTVDVQVGSQRSPGDGVLWGDVKTLDLANGAKYKIDTRKTGRYLAYRIGTWTGTARTGGWELAGMDIDVMDGGR